MEIRNTSNVDVPRDAGPETAPARAGDSARAADGSRPSSLPASADRVTLTEAARRLLETPEARLGAPVDEARVAAIRAAIADGSYTVNAERIAERLVELDNPAGS